MRKIAGALGGIVLVVGAGCHSTTAPSLTTTSTSTTSTASAPAISGVVMEGTRPLAGVSVDAGAYGPGSWVVTDANGAFQLPAGLNGGGWLRASQGGYLQPCALRIAGNGPFTIQLVSRSALTGTPLSSPSGFRTISGVVRQATRGTLQGVEGAFVAFEPDPTNTDWDPAYTVTDSSGRFTLCGLPQNAVLIESVSTVPAADARVTVPSDQTYIEIDLP